MLFQFFNSTITTMAVGHYFKLKGITVMKIYFMEAQIVYKKDNNTIEIIITMQNNNYFFPLRNLINAKHRPKIKQYIKCSNAKLYYAKFTYLLLYVCV